MARFTPSFVLKHCFQRSLVRTRGIAPHSGSDSRRLLEQCRAGIPYADAGSSRHVVDATFSATACIAVRKCFGLRLNPPAPGGSLIELCPRTSYGRIGGNSDICPGVEN